MAARAPAYRRRRRPAVIPKDETTWSISFHRPLRSASGAPYGRSVVTTESAQATGFAVHVNGLTKRFGNRVVVDHLDLALPSGSVSGFVGPNGAGKTTTIRMLLGLIEPTEGTGTLLGGDLADPPSYLHKVGALIEAPAFYPQLSGKDNLL